MGWHCASLVCFSFPWKTRRLLMSLLALSLYYCILSLSFVPSMHFWKPFFCLKLAVGFSGTCASSTSYLSSNKLCALVDINRTMKGLHMNN